MIATGFGGRKGRPRREIGREPSREPVGRGADRPSSERNQPAPTATSFDVPAEVLEVPSFLRDN